MNGPDDSTATRDCRRMADHEYASAGTMPAHGPGRKAPPGRTRCIAFVLTTALLTGAGAAVADPDPCATIGQPILRVETAGDIRVYYTGPADAPAGARAVTALWLEDITRGVPVRFEPPAGLPLSRSPRAVVAPGGGHVLLPQGRHGPYHVVSDELLYAYLEGAAEPVASLQWRSETGVVGIHAAPAWHGPSQGSFLVHCCGSTLVVAFDLNADGEQLLHSAEDTELRERLRARLLGSFRVTRVMPASDTPHTLEAREAAGARKGETIVFGDRLVRPGGTCRQWDIEPSDRSPPEEPVLAEQFPAGAFEGGTWVTLQCGDSRIDSLFLPQGDTHRFVTRTPNGVAWLIWDREEGADQTAECAPPGE